MGPLPFLPDYPMAAGSGFVSELRHAFGCAPSPVK